MLNFFKKKNDPEAIYSPVNGQCILLENVPDQMFAQKLMGEGAGFTFEEDTVYAPCDGEIMMIAHTKYAIGIKSKNGAEILVHIGLDTVELNGKGFEVLIQSGQKIKAHSPMIKINRMLMSEKNINLTTPLVITNKDDVDVELNEIRGVTIESVIMTVKKK